MKKLIIILLFPFYLSAQTTEARYQTIVTYDTTLIFKGIDTVHTHAYVKEIDGSSKNNLALMGIYVTEFICTLCLRNYTVKILHIRSDKFLEAKNRLLKIHPF